jgi:carboxymethylenebutenolidase
MNENVSLQAADCHHFDTYVARPEAEAIAGLVVVQEAFGVNAHIRRVADRYASDGFLAIAPALFDRMERGVELGYEGAEREKAMGLARQIDLGDAMKDISAALEYVRGQTGRKCGVIGYCLGGTAAWLAATRLQVHAAVGYYGGYISRFAEEEPRCPVMLHFGTQDKHIPKEDIDRVQQLHPKVKIFRYDAGHGFNCEDRASYNPEAAKLARERSLAFLKQRLA